MRNKEKGYISVSLPRSLVREIDKLIGTPYVEVVAVMAKHNSFAEKIEMQRVIEKAARKVTNIMNFLYGMEFNLSLLTSGNYVFGRLRSLGGR